MANIDGIERGPAARSEDIVKAIEKSELARLQVPKVDIFLFKGEKVSEWLELFDHNRQHRKDRKGTKAVGTDKVKDGVEDEEMVAVEVAEEEMEIATPTEEETGIGTRQASRSGRAPQAVRTRAKGSISSDELAKDVPEPSGEKGTVDIPEDEDEEDARLRRKEDKRAEQRAKKRGVETDTDTVLEGKKKKYTVRVEEGYDVEEMMDKILEGHNHLMNLKDVLASAPRLRDELKARLSKKMVASVRLGAIIPKEAEWSETGTKMDWKSVACGCLDVIVKGKTCTTMVDTGAEMNLIKEEHVVRLGMEIDRFDNGVLMRANSRSVFVGTASGVILEIGKIKVRSCFFIMPDLDHPILLGRSFLSRTDTLILNKHDETMFLVLCDPVCGNNEVITCRNTRARSIRNRPNPGSFTIEESVEERRLGRDEFEGERQPEALTLSLASIGDAMDIVSTYGMADPKVVEALKEKKEEAAKEREVDKMVRVAREKEIRVHLRLKNLAEMRDKMQQGSQPVEVEAKKRAQKDDPPLLTEAWESFDRLMEAAGKPTERHQEMGVKLFSTDLLSPKGLMKEGFATAKASDEKIERRVTKVAQASHGQRVNWEREIKDLKKEVERQGKEVDVVKTEMVDTTTENGALKLVNQTLNKVNDVLRGQLQAQQTSFQAKEVE
ncbi:hypothetical protein CBR_g50157 [Chara braunii]|uniref:Peptidase A2 domain-containing protein n=1 Tax=Chara braunii TaxID=69332 RepID=A0A388M651_CHABU|nr:hypothetical protein CBR_g50157 [Chara braunii]|eukprot:GBG90064.1 hypothetical protein CBR_g50157 [Chara braunii]